MFTAHCPSCQSRLPLSELLTVSVVCPRCHCELRPQRWSMFAPSLLTIWTAMGVAHFAEDLQFNFGIRIVLATVCGLAAGALGQILFVRYRPKDPGPSILPSPDAP